MPNLVGIGLSQVPTNSMLGGLAYQDPEHASIKDLDLKNLSQINSEIADTAANVFIYDTSKDSDGGAWRKRTTDTSWYNETLNTATRGSRREFPSVAVIVAEVAKVTIYDGDDPDLPMWMVFNQQSSGGSVANHLAFNAPISSFFMLNGILCVGFSSANGWGISQIEFVSDSQEFRWTGGRYILPEANNIAKRNVASGWFAYDISTANIGLANAQVYAVGMRALPNSQIDPYTGLPVPTIAVGTNSGLSVITDSKVVYEVNNFSPVKNTGFTGDRLFIHTMNAPITYAAIGMRKLTVDIALDSWEFGNQFNTGATQGRYIPASHTKAIVTPTNEMVFGGGSTGLFKIQTDGLVERNGDESNIKYEVTTSYNSGSMHGDIKAAFLADTDIEDDVELVSNGTFNVDTTGWTVVGGGSATVSSGQAQLTNNGTTNGSLDQTITTVVGKTYEISANITPQGGGPLPRLYAGNSYAQVASNSNSSQLVTFSYTATSTSTIISVNANTNVNNAVTLADNISVKLTNNVTPGSNTLTSGSFNSSTGWTLGSGWTISGGKLNKTSTDNNTAYYTATGLIVGKAYTFSIDVETVGSGTLYFYALGVYTTNPTLTTTGTHSLTVVANATSMDFGITGISGNGAVLDNAGLTIGEPDRSVENRGPRVYGTITKTPVATGAELIEYSGFTPNNYLRYDASNMNFGTGDFSVSVWCIPSTDTTNEFILELDDSSEGSNRFYLLTTATATKKLYTPWNNNIAGSELTTGAWNHVVVGRKAATTFVYVNGKKIAAGTQASWTTSLNGNGFGTISNYSGGIANNYAWSGSLALLRISGTAPSDEQIKKMYHDERMLFQENAKCTLYGSSDVVTALAYDEVTNLLHVGTSSGRSDFQGLRRINNTTVGITSAISAHDEFIIEQ